MAKPFMESGKKKHNNIIIAMSCLNNNLTIDG